VGWGISQCDVNFEAVMGKTLNQASGNEDRKRILPRHQIKGKVEGKREKCEVRK
jgi:hypothetical protein